MGSNRWERWSYGRLLISQPHVRVEGLWRSPERHFVVCPNVDRDRATDGRSLREWFDNSGRAITSPIHIVAAVPEGAERVEARSAEELATLSGEPLTVRDVFVALHLALPIEFPNFHVLDDESSGTVICVPRELSNAEQVLLRGAYAQLDLPGAYRLEVRNDFEPSELEFRHAYGQGDIELRPSRRLGRRFSSSLRQLVEEDDDFWSKSRKDLLAADADVRRQDVLPRDFVTSETSCLVDASIFPPTNIRNQLTLYETTFLVAPLGDRLTDQCTALGITQHELAELVSIGRVRLLLPQSIDRYDIGWLSAIAETAPNHLLLSRRLATATVIETRRRWPLLYPSLGTTERRVVLEWLSSEVRGLGPGPIRLWGESLLRTLSAAWNGVEHGLNMRGAMGTGHVGIGALAAELFESFYGRDLRLEFWSAASDVEWAAALGASLFPVSTEGYSEHAASELLASLLGAPGEGCPTLVGQSVRVALDGILSVSNTVPAVPFAKEFGSSDVRRLRSIVRDMAKWNQHPSFLNEAIEAFNADVRQVEQRQEYLRALTLDRIAPATATATAAILSHVDPATSFGVLISSGILVGAARAFAGKNIAIGKIVDFIDGALVGKKSDAVLVARVRKQLRGLK